MSYVFGHRSSMALASCDPRLEAIFRLALSWQIMDFSVLEGHRGEEKQNAAFDDGKSQIRWPKGKHNKIPSLAADVAPYPIDWGDTERFCVLAGIVFAAAAQLGHTIRWGGDWNSDGFTRDESFRDRGHFELVD